MGTKVQYKSCFGGYNPMRDLDDDLNANSWPILCGERNIPNTGIIPSIAADVYTGYDKTSLKHKMIEHDAIFKKQVHELHRVYKIQKDMMEEMKRKEHCRHGGSIEPSSSSIQGSQVPYDDVRKSHLRSHPYMDSCYPRSTMSGAENVNSPLSYTKMNTMFASRVASKNGFTKEFEVSEARPSKVRKKLFDLQLPADEHVDLDDDEQLHKNASGHSSFTPCKEFKTPESSMKLTVGSAKMGGLQEFSSVSRSSNGLADLNEPINIEEVTESSSANSFGHSSCNGGSKGIYFSAKTKPGFLSLQKEVVQKSIHGNQQRSLNNMPADRKINGREWFPYSYEAGHGGGSSSSNCRGVQLDFQSLPPNPSRAMLHQAYSSGSHLTDHSKEDVRNVSLGRGLAAPHRNTDYSNHSHVEPVMASQVSNPLPFMNCSNDAGTWPQLMQSFGKPTDLVKPKLTSFHTYTSLGSSSSLNKVLQSSALSNKWHVSSSFSSNPCLASDLPPHNGFYQGSSSGSKDLPVCFSSTGFNHLISNRSDSSASRNMINGNVVKEIPSGFVDIKPQIDMDLNATFPKNGMEEPVIRQDLDRSDGNCKPGVHQSSFPWLRTKPAFNSEATNSRREVIFLDASSPRASPCLSSGKSKAVIDLNEVYNDTSASDNPVRFDNETNGLPIVEKILGVPIFEKLGVSENRVLPLISSTTEAEHAGHKRKNKLIDINVACDVVESEEEPLTEDEMGSGNQLDRSSCGRNYIDLNACFVEDEDPPPVATVGSITLPNKVIFDIDLEALAVPEEEDNFLPEGDKDQEQDITLDAPDDTEQTEDEAMRSAAEAIYKISSCPHINQENVTCSPTDAAGHELLVWFADVVSTTPTFGKEDSLEVMDDFEAMILQLPETKEEDFMPKPFVFEDQKVEETGTKALPIRPRRGQGRRGRQRRDFQRDILPGLVSLSRLEMTEDIQTFGGLMKAMGHSWNSGSTRRNGGRNRSGRGRRRTVAEAPPTAPPAAPCTKLMQQIDNVETSLEKRSLTSWGKTTRRPRRQRCPAGNAPTVSLT